MMLICLIGFASCGNADRHVKQLVDNYTHSGKLRGYAFIYEKNNDGDFKMSEKTYPVYEYEDGSFSIKCEGENYGLTELDSPISLYGNSIYQLRYKIDYKHYIEEIPTSY